MASTLEQYSPKSIEQNTHDFPLHWKEVGDVFVFENEDEAPIEIAVVKIENARIVAASLGLNLERDVPVYHLDKTPLFKKRRTHALGAYVDRWDAIFFYPVTDEVTKRHEIVHAIEYRQQVTVELQNFFDRIKALYPEGMEINGNTTFNFAKNIHEFLADGYTSKVVTETLKVACLYDEFLAVTAYLNVLKK